MMESTETKETVVRMDDESFCRLTCRSCLASTERLVPIFETKVEEKMWEVAEVRVTPDDGLPQGLCSQCFAALLGAFEFRRRCRRSDEVLRRRRNFPPLPTFLDLHREIIKVEVNIPKLDNENYVAEENFGKNEKSKCLEWPDASRKGQGMYHMNTHIGKRLSDEMLHRCQDPLPPSEVMISERIEPMEPVEPSEFVKVELDIQQNYALQSKPQQKIQLDRERPDNFLDPNHSMKFPNFTSLEFTCSECSYSCKSRQLLQSHMRKHTDEMPYTCNECGDRFTRKALFRTHLTKHIKEVDLMCNECGKQFKQPKSFETHKQRHIDKITKRFICDICNKGLRSKETLIDHLNRHYNIKKFRCKTCGSLFVSRPELLCHVRMHISDKNFACNVCDFRTHRKASLNKHLLRHTGNKMFNCDLCELSFFRTTELISHQIKHTTEQKYSCSICMRKFKHYTSLNAHMLKNHGTKDATYIFDDKRRLK